MAQLVTATGLKILFDPSDVVAVSDHDDAADEMLTCVYGINSGPLKISETVDDFLGRLDLTSTFAKLTRPNLTPIWLRASAVTSIRPTLAGEYNSNARSVVSVGTFTQAVCEDLESAAAAIDTHRGKF